VAYAYPVGCIFRLIVTDFGQSDNSVHGLGFTSFHGPFIVGKYHQTQKNRQRGCAKISDAPWPAGKLSGVAALRRRASQAMGVPFGLGV